MLTGNREFNEIYEKYKNLVLKVAYIYSGNNYDAAEDITQDTFLKLYTGFKDFKREKIPTWVIYRYEKLSTKLQEEIRASGIDR